MMTKQKADQLEEQYYNFIDLIKNSFPLEKMSSLFAADIMGYGSNLDEKTFNLSELYEGFRIQKEQSVGLELQFAFTPISRRISQEENVAIYVDEIGIMMTIEGVRQESVLRLSIIFEFIEERWICIHFHGSRAVNIERDAWTADLWKKKNEELQRMVDERTIQLQNSILELKSTQAQLIQSEKLASLGELTAGIAHEIQNPLNFVNNFSEVNKELVEELEEAIGIHQAGGRREEAGVNSPLVAALLSDIKQNLEKISHHGKRADAIVKGMLLHSRTSGLTREPTDINKLADEYLRLAYHGMRAKDNAFNSTLQTDFDESIGNVNIIPQDIGRVMLNIINNAFHAVQAKALAKANAVDEKKKSGIENYEPIVSISTKKDGNNVLICIKDNGDGVPQKILDKIFQPFFTTKPTGQGTGLGLSLSYDIVKAHGGEIKVKSEEGVGSEFTVVLKADE